MRAYKFLTINAKMIFLCYFCLICATSFSQTAQDFLKSSQSKSKRQDFLGAIEDCNKAISIKPDYAEAYLERAVIHKNLKNFKKVKEDADMALHYKGNDYPSAYHMRGIAKIQLGDAQGALEDLNKTLSKSFTTGIESGDILVDIGDAHFMLGNYTQALDSYNDALKLGYLKFVYYKTGMVKYKLKDYSGALNDLDKAIRAFPKYSEAYYYRGLTYQAIENYNQAIQNYSKAVAIKSDYIHAYYDRGVAKTKINDHKGAVMDFTQTISLNPVHTDAYLNRGLSNLKAGDKKMACADLKKAIELGSTQAKEFLSLNCK